MKDNELLSAIAGLLDEKLDEKLDARLKPIETDIREMKTDIRNLKTDVKGLKTDVEGLKTDVQTLKSEMKEVKTEIRTMKTEIYVMKEDITVMKDDIRRINLFQENVILPRLNTIESCYTDTYRRYQTYNERMATAFEDIDLLKKVVAEHSEKLQKIS